MGRLSREKKIKMIVEWTGREVAAISKPMISGFTARLGCRGRGGAIPVALPEGLNEAETDCFCAGWEVGNAEMSGRRVVGYADHHDGGEVAHSMGGWQSPSAMIRRLKAKGASANARIEYYRNGAPIRMVKRDTIS